jgi:hypothetical protein
MLSPSASLPTLLVARTPVRAELRRFEREAP